MEEMIVTALAERKRKTGLISGWERRSALRTKLVPAVVFLAAACIAAVFMLMPGGETCMDVWNASGCGTVEAVMRAAGDCDADRLISEGEYGKALQELDEEIEAIVIEDLDMSDEESAYEAAMVKERRKELLWKRIYVLSLMDRRDDVIDALENFTATYGESGYPAEEYLRMLKKVSD